MVVFFVDWSLPRVSSLTTRYLFCFDKKQETRMPNCPPSGRMPSMPRSSTMLWFPMPRRMFGRSNITKSIECRRTCRCCLVSNVFPTTTLPPGFIRCQNCVLLLSLNSVSMLFIPIFLVSRPYTQSVPILLCVVQFRSPGRSFLRAPTQV